jgi:O-acetyl-ADP-ribose deacetylase (regulator of RNase III)
MTPLGTGVGRVSYEQWARQAVLAVKHWLESVEDPERWMKRDWADVARIEAELKLTHGL